MRRLLLLAAMSLATTMLFVAPAAATPPQDVTITIAEVFHANGPCTGDITASGGVFGQSTTGSMECQSFSPVGASWALPTAAPPHLFEYTAVDHRLRRELARERRDRRLRRAEGRRHVH